MGVNRVIDWTIQAHHSGLIKSINLQRRKRPLRYCIPSGESISMSNVELQRAARVYPIPALNADGGLCVDIKSPPAAQHKRWAVRHHAWYPHPWPRRGSIRLQRPAALGRKWTMVSWFVPPSAITNCKLTPIFRTGHLRPWRRPTQQLQRRASRLHRASRQPQPRPGGLERMALAAQQDLLSDRSIHRPINLPQHLDTRRKAPGPGHSAAVNDWVSRAGDAGHHAAATVPRFLYPKLAVCPVGK
jgi:hypothetical protein